MKNWFFYKLYLFDKRLFFFLAIGCGLTVFFNVMGDEVTPFFIWAMYSEKENPKNTYKIFTIQVNDSVLVDYTRGYPYHNRFFLSSPLAYYDRMKKNNFTDPTLSFLEIKLGIHYAAIRPLAENVHNGSREQKMFTAWYKRYLEQTTGHHINKLKVDVLSCHFAANQHVQIDSGYSLLTWQQ